MINIDIKLIKDKRRMGDAYFHNRSHLDNCDVFKHNTSILRWRVTWGSNSPV